MKTFIKKGVLQILFVNSVLWAGILPGSIIAAEESQYSSADKPVVIMTTNLGNIIITLDRQAAPITVTNFLNYVDNHFYDGLIFHRVIDNFMIQTGGHRFDTSAKHPTSGNIINESSNGLKNITGSVAMARRSHPDSANAQFFINLGNNPHLDATSKAPGYTVFGQVTDGLDVVATIGKVPVEYISAQLANTPVTAVQILSIKRKESD